MAKYILAIDQGTTSSRAILFNDKSEMIDSAQEEFEQHFPHDGWVEHQPDDIWSSVANSCQSVMKKLTNSRNDIAAIGITNQRETTLIWDKKNRCAYLSCDCLAG